MALIRPKVTVDLAPLIAIEKRGRAMPRLLRTAVRREIGRIASDAIEEVSTPLGAHKRPTDWQVPKQRRFWFWALKMGVITWAGRTGALSKAWKAIIKIDDNGGLFSISNNRPEKAYVQGVFQQRMHVGVWVNEEVIIPKYRVIAQGKLIEVYMTVSNPFANVPQS